MTFSIGRDRSCDIPIADDSVSKRHAEFQIDADGKLSLSDQGSTNGTILIVQGRERKIGKEAVTPDDSVRFGSVTLRVRDLLEAVRQKFPGEAVARQPKSIRLAEKLVRCECGAVVKKGARCGVCSAG